LYLLSNYDYVKDANRIYVKLDEANTVKAQLYSYDSEVELCILKIMLDGVQQSTIKKLQVADFGSSEGLGVGSFVMCLGNPNGLIGSMDYGFVMSPPVEQAITDYKVKLYYTNMNYYLKGNGVVFDQNGKLIGVTTHYFDESIQEDRNVFMGISELSVIIKQLLENRQKMYVGVLVYEMTMEDRIRTCVDHGVYINKVQNDSPAFRAGLLAGDVILGIDGENIESVDDFYAAIANRKKGESLRVCLKRTTASMGEALYIDVKCDIKNK